jgi:hypothetical protein
MFNTLEDGSEEEDRHKEKKEEDREQIEENYNNDTLYYTHKS